MKAILEFSLPEDKREFIIANEGEHMHSTLCSMDQWLRGKIKYAPEDISDDSYETFELCREQLHNFLNENNINLDI